MAKLFPVIKENLLWLEQNLGILMTQIEEKLHNGADIGLFRQLHIVSFTLHFESKYNKPLIRLAYGDDGIYVLVGIKEKEILTVLLNSI